MVQNEVVKTRMLQSGVLASCALAGAIAGGVALNNKHHDMADRVIHCVEAEPASEVVTRLTQFCLDEASMNDPTLEGSAVRQEFAIGTPFSELRTVSQQYRDNNVDPGIIGGAFMGLAIGTTAVVLTAPRRRRLSSAPQQTTETVEIDDVAERPVPRELHGATVWSPDEATTTAVPETSQPAYDETSSVRPPFNRAS